VQADTCYHMSCDTEDNISEDAVRELSQAIAFVLETLALDENLAERIYQGANVHCDPQSEFTGEEFSS